MKHVKQKNGLGTCGAVAYAAILGLTELQAIRECKTKMRGRGARTLSSDVQEAFSQRGIDTHVINGNFEKLQDIFWLKPCSTHFPIYLSTQDKKRSRSSHAIALMDGYIYDGHFDARIPLEAYPNVVVRQVMIIDKELPDYGYRKEIEEELHRITS